MAQPLSALAVPEVLYSRFSNKNYEYKGWQDAVSNLYGDSSGMGLSTVPYLYTLSEDERRRTKQKDTFFLRIQFRWPAHGKFADEGDKNDMTQHTYETYHKSNFVGVIRKFLDQRRFVILEPLRYIESILDEGKDKLLLKKEIERSPEEHFGVHQTRFDTLFKTLIGDAYVDPERDVFCLSEISRRSRKSIAVVEKDLSKIVGRIKIQRASGCWMSERKSDYKRTFWLALGGIQVRHLYFFPSETGSMFIKDKNLLHSLICELTLGKDHSRCCRPSHLKIGTAAENANHIKIRKRLEQLFDLSPPKMMEYTAYIRGIANIMNEQLQIMTAEENQVYRRRKARRVVYWEDISSKERGSYNTGGAVETRSAEEQLEIFADKYQLCPE